MAELLEVDSEIGKPINQGFQMLVCLTEQNC
jgi:hypothetical protein